MKKLAIFLALTTALLAVDVTFTLEDHSWSNHNIMYKGTATDWAVVQMYDDGTNGDLFANDGIYSLEIPTFLTSNDLKFYIRAENNDAITLSPERAEYEFYTYSFVNSISENSSLKTKKLIKVVDQLGRPSINKKGIPLFFIYDDGSVEKKIEF